MSARGAVHVIPMDDIVDHVCGVQCVCVPVVRLPANAADDPLVVHIAMDGRAQDADALKRES